MLVDATNERQRHGRRAASTIMNLTDATVFSQMRQQQVNLFVQCFKIFFNAFGLCHGHRIAATIVAKMPAKRHMDIERDVIGCGIVRRFNGFQIARGIERLKFIGRRIARIAWNGHIIFLEKRFVHCCFAVLYRCNV